MKCVISNFVLLVLIAKAQGKQIKVVRVGGICHGHKEFPIIYNCTSSRTEGTFLYMNGTYTVKEDINNPISISVRIERCKQKDNLDTCELFHRYRGQKYCDMIKLTSDMWGTFFSSVRPKWQCPIKAGSYKSINGKFDASAFVLFPVENWYWRIETDLYDTVTNRLLTCIQAEGYVII